MFSFILFLFFVFYLFFLFCFFFFCLFNYLSGEMSGPVWEFSAASKEALHLNILTLGLEQNKLAIEYFQSASDTINMYVD
jgi:hypothetical protein